MTQRILVPLDGSSLSEAAIPWASALGRRLNLPISLVRVIPWPPSAPVVTRPMEEMLRTEHQAATEYLEPLTAGLTSEGVTADFIYREGDPADRLRELADEQDAFATVMSTHGRGGASRAFLGSVATRLLHVSQRPVLLVRSVVDGEVMAPSVDRVLVALDGSAFSTRALDAALALTRDGGALRLITAVPPVYLPVGVPDSAVVTRDEEATQQAIVEERAALVTLAKEKVASSSADVAVVEGEPADAILENAAAWGANIIIMSTHGRTGLTRLLVGSVADEVARHATCPVLLVPARD
jgi:nucleotide-binding universal stress UspA family protein